MNTSQTNPQETILFETGKHGVVFFKSFVWALAGYYLIHIHAGPMLLPTIKNSTSALFISAFVLLYFLNTLFNFQFSRYTITKQNVIMCDGYGLLQRETFALPLARFLTPVDINQTLLGRLLNYGTISISMANKSYSYVRNPNQFQKTIIEWNTSQKNNQQ